MNARSPAPVAVQRQGFEGTVAELGDAIDEIRKTAESVLSRLAGLDEPQLDAAPFSPGQK
jgi:hypothetical protein